MNDSILNSIKRLLGIPETYDVFDLDLIMHINSVFFILMQIGLKKEPFRIEGASETWADYLNDKDDLEGIKTYVYMRVRKLFDPPTSATLMTALNETIAEIEWRLNIQVDPGEEET